MQGFVRTVYCVSAKIPQDAAAHIVGRSHDYVDSIYKQARMVTGWAEFQKNKSMTFDAGILEVDSCRTATRKNKVGSKKRKMTKKPAGNTVAKKPTSKVAVHGGRFLVAVSRKNKQSAFYPLPDRFTATSAPGPPETLDEVVPLLQHKVNPSKHILGSDASKGLKGARKKLNLEAVTARHSLSEYTPVQSLKKSKVSTTALKAIGCKAAQTGRHKVTMVGGDQVAESHTALLKQQLRRNNKLGGLSLKTAHVDGLSALYIHKNLGLEATMMAFAQFIAHMTDKVSHVKCFEDVSWMEDK